MRYFLQGPSVTDTPLAIVTAMFDARASGGPQAMLAYVADDMVHIFNVNPDREGNGDVLVGRAAALDHIRRLMTEWDELAYTVVTLREAGEFVIATIDFRLQHRASLYIIESRKRQEWKVENGRVTALFEVLDAELINAFRRMTRGDAGD